MMDFPDPFSRIDDVFSRMTPGMGRGATPEYRKPFTPDDFKPFQQKLLDYGGTGLRGIFSTLSAPGDYVRGALAGDLGNRVSGRELLDKWHITDKHDKGWLSWGLGLGADIATDPLTYTTFGAKHALTPLGRTLSKTGELSNWSRKGMLEGFHATESGLQAAGRTADEIAHLKRGGLISGLNTTPWRVASAQQEQLAQNALGRAIEPGERLGGMVGFGLPYMSKLTIGGGRRAACSPEPWTRRATG